ncbi:helix-turn-helix domain-containing protein [Streptomyces sp. NPDC050548]|uniref:helix-turn-helix domain-containing protein n=1 Tax=Streptomyces sp. NPDC050548 TaxID=3365629 RepID=UPI00378BBF4C
MSVSVSVRFGADALKWSPNDRVRERRSRKADRLLPQCRASEGDATTARRCGSVALGTIRKIERGERGVTDTTLEAIAHALGVDPIRLRADRRPAQGAVRDALPTLPPRSPPTTCPRTARHAPCAACVWPWTRPSTGDWAPNTRVSSARSPT